MQYGLSLHPDSSGAALTKIDVKVTRSRDGALMLQFGLAGNIERLILPSLAAPQRADALWRHTCFEAFIRLPSGDTYYEFNFSPSTQWAAYGFGSYRSGMTNATWISPPQITVTPGVERYEVAVSLELGNAPDLPGDRAWEVGLSAVIEDMTGGKSYWALAHPPGKPDFHHSDCFALQIPPAFEP